MRPLPISESIRLPESQAVQRRLDDANWKTLRWLLLGFSCGALIGTIVGLVEGPRLYGVAWGAAFLASVLFLITRRRSFVERYFRRLLIGYLILIMAVLLTVSPDVGFSYSLGGFITPFVLLFMRLRRAELFSLLALCMSIAAWFVFGPQQQPPLPMGGLIGMTAGAAVSILLVAGLATRLTRKLELRFLVEWRRERSRAREQTRMRDELNDARQIQLSMLPRTTPQLPWLDLASVSLPATEVGGDYFDYVPIDQDRLAMVVGDVAGHGMASGLVLAAIRGGLHLLRDELATPIKALQRLDRMVQEVSPGRLFVTLQIGILDHTRRRITLVSAGHPPALLYRAAHHDVIELGAGAVPLGTRLESRLVEQTADLEPGDVLVFYTDGLPEAMDLRGEVFGDDRLRKALERAATGHSAAEIRTILLETVNRFKGDVELADDITLVVAKLSG